MHISNEILKIFKKRKTLLLLSFSFFGPIICSILVFTLLGIDPFGNNNLTFSDSRALYVPCVSLLSRIIKDQESLFYTFSKGIGGNAYSLITCYAGNPLLLLFCFFDITSYSTAFTLIYILHFGFSGLAMYILLSYLFGENWKSLIFSIIYAFSGYIVAYCWHAMWISDVCLLPLVTLGLIKIVKENKSNLYFISLFFTILTNFYIGFAICIFTLLAYFVIITIYKKNIKETLPKYLITSFLAGFSTSFVWLPTFLSLRDARLSGITISDYSLPPKIKITEFLAKFFPCANNFDEYKDGSPIVFCTLSVVFLVIVFFCGNNKVSKKSKTSIAALLSVYLISFFFQPLSNIFQGFSRPYWFNYRYSFIFSFIFIIIALYQFNNIQDVNKKICKKVLIILMLIGLFIISSHIEFVNEYAIILELVITSIFAFLILSPKIKISENKKNLGICLTFITSLIINFFGTFKSVDEYLLDSQKEPLMIFAISSLTEGIQDSDPSFYRLEVPECHRDGGDPLLFGYNGTSSFSSTEKLSVLKGLKQFGINQKGGNHNNYLPDVPPTMDSFLGIKYLLSVEETQGINKNYNEKLNLFSHYIFENPTALPLGINIKGTPIEDIDKTINSFEFQNIIWKSITGKEKNIFTPVKNVKIELTNTFNISSKMDSKDTSFPDVESNSINLEINNSKNFQENTNTLSVFFTAEQDGPVYLQQEFLYDSSSGADIQSFVYIGNFKKGDNVKKDIYLSRALSQEGLDVIAKHLPVYYENRDVLNEYADLIKAQDLTIVKEKSNHITGTINSDNDTNILFTFPYDENWKILVDGQEVKADKFANILFSIPVKKGKHTFSLFYTPPLFNQSILISAVSLIVYILYQFIISKKERELTYVSNY